MEFEFVFEPFEKGEKISLAGSWLVLLLLLGGAGYYIYTRMSGRSGEGKKETEIAGSKE